MAASGQAYGQAQQQVKKEATTAASIDALLPKLQQAAASGAPEADLLRYLEVNGITRDQFNKRSAELDLARTTRGGALGGFIRQMAQGVTFGFADEAASAVKAATTAPFSDKTFGEIYDKELGENRAADTAMQTSHPVASTIAQIAGAAVPIIATGGAAAAPTAARTTGQVIGRGALTGAGYGGLAGFGNAEGGVQNRALGAGTGAAIGGILGAAVPVTLAGGKKVVQMAQRTLGTTNADELAAQKVLQALSRDKMSPQSLGQKYADALAADPRKPIAPVDVAGENTRRLVDQAFLTPGKAADDAMTFFGERQAAQPERVMADVAKYLPDENFYGTKEALTKFRSAAAAPLYEEANSAAIKISPRAQRFLDDPIAQQAYETGIKLQRLEAITNGKPFLNRAGEELIRNKPNFRMMTAVKEGLDDMVEKYRDPTTGKLQLDKMGIAIRDFRNSFVEQLDKMNPKYSDARAAWAGPSQAMDALQLGREVFSKDAEVTAKMLRDMPESMKDFYKMGAFRAIMDKVQSTRDGADVVKRFFGTPQYRARLSAVFGKDFQKFERLMGLEKTMFGTAQQVLGNSKTAQRLAGAADADSEALNTAGRVIMGDWSGALKEFARRSIAKIGGMRPDVADAISRTLLQGNPAQVMAALKALQSNATNVARKASPSSGGPIPSLAGATAGANIGAQFRDQ